MQAVSPLALHPSGFYYRSEKYLHAHAQAENLPVVRKYAALDPRISQFQHRRCHISGHIIRHGSICFKMPYARGYHSSSFCSRSATVSKKTALPCLLCMNASRFFMPSLMDSSSSRVSALAFISRRLNVASLSCWIVEIKSTIVCFLLCSSFSCLIGLVIN